MQVPIYAHVKQTLDPLLGKRDGLEINYMKFLAYNGPYRLFRSLWVGPLGAHDADWSSLDTQPIEALLASTTTHHPALISRNLKPSKLSLAVSCALLTLMMTQVFG